MSMFRWTFWIFLALAVIARLLDSTLWCYVFGWGALVALILGAVHVGLGTPTPKQERDA